MRKFVWFIACVVCLLFVVGLVSPAHATGSIARPSAYCGASLTSPFPQICNADGTAEIYALAATRAAAICTDGPHYYFPTGLFTINATTAQAASLTRSGCPGNPNDVVSGVTSSATAQSCPTGSTLSGSTCTCNGLTVPDAFGANCVATPTCTAGTTISAGYHDIGTNPTVITTSVCDGGGTGCAYAYTGSGPVDVRMVNGVRHYFASGSYTSTGSACPTSGSPAASTLPVVPTATANLPADTCATGYAPGTVNGRGVCVSTGVPGTTGPVGSVAQPSASSTSTTSTVVNPDSSTTRTTTTTTTNVNGSTGTTVTSTTTAPNGTVTSATTVTGAVGGAGAASGAGTGGTGGQGTLGGACSDNSSASGCGGGGATIPTLYTKKSLTAQQVIQGFQTQVQAAPFMQDVSGFFVVSNAGACPSSTWVIPWINASVAFTAFCEPFALSAYAVMRIALQLVALVLAFSIAFL